MEALGEENLVEKENFPADLQVRFTMELGFKVHLSWVNIINKIFDTMVNFIMANLQE